MVEKIIAIKKCHDDDELLEALELTRDALETARHSSSAILHRLYAEYLKELEVPTSNSEHRKLILSHAEKAVSLFPTSMGYRYFYASLLYEDIWVPDEVVIRECRSALLLGGSVEEEDPYWTIFFVDDDDGEDETNEAAKVIDGVNDLMLKVKMREEGRKRRRTSKEEPAKAELKRPRIIVRFKC